MKLETDIGSKALGVASRLAVPMGVASGWLSAPTGGEGFGGLDQIPDFLVDRLSGWKIANPIITTQIALSQPALYPIMDGAKSALLGWGIQLVGDAIGMSFINRAGGALKKFGGAQASNALIAAWVYEAKNNPHGGGASAGATVSRGGVVNRHGRTARGVDVDNPQGLAPMYPGGYTSQSFQGNM